MFHCLYSMEEHLPTFEGLSYGPKGKGQALGTALVPPRRCAYAGAMAAAGVLVSTLPTSVHRYIQTLHDVEDFRYSAGFLNALHWMLQGHRHTMRKPAGQWRKGPVYVTDARDPSIAAYTAPEALDVPGLMREFCDWLNTDNGDHPLIRAAMAHLHLVSIHPWADGNGRMSRSLQTLIIARDGVLAPEFSSIEAWLGRPGNTWEYYAVLARRGATYHPDQDVSDWIRFNLTAYHQQGQTVKARLGRSNRVWALPEEFARQRRLDGRVVTALHDAAISGRVRRTLSFECGVAPVVVVGVEEVLQGLGARLPVGGA
ncbi:Fic family protein [Nonomuraea jabiensis]|uniref:Fic family protein n=1 Tax=Nonomuraea jabiensis TaxID=882448 RepID=UPI0036CEED17